MTAIYCYVWRATSTKRQGTRLPARWSLESSAPPARTPSQLAVGHTPSVRAARLISDVSGSGSPFLVSAGSRPRLLSINPVAASHSRQAALEMSIFRWSWCPLQDRCRTCGRFIRRSSSRVPFCQMDHAVLAVRLLGAEIGLLGCRGSVSGGIPRAAMRRHCTRKPSNRVVWLSSPTLLRPHVSSSEHSPACEPWAH